MKAAIIRERLRGFGPHVIRTSDGQRFRVDHEFFFVGNYNIVIEGEEGVLEVIDPLRVVSIRRASPPAKAAA